MKTVHEMNAEELMLLISVVSLRVTAFAYAMSATHELLRLVHYIDSLAKDRSTDTYTSQTYSIDIGFYMLIAVLLFLLSVPLSRLLCRGIIEVLQLIESRKSLTSQS